ncbi:MAG: hypothetical protein KC496_04750 [Anaerolineae bacterium]|nr:hypothetical protein [Anaerolineae bacterium]
MAINPSFKQRMMNLNLTDIGRIFIIAYLGVMASAITNRPETAVTGYVSQSLGITYAMIVFLFNLCFMGGILTYALVDRTWPLVIWTFWPLVFNALSAWRTIHLTGEANTQAVNSIFIYILLMLLLVMTEVFEQRQTALLSRVAQHEKDCAERIKRAAKEETDQ